MAEVRSCIHFSVLFLCFQLAIGKPMFGTGWCNFFCEDDDGVTTDSAEDYLDVFICGGCDTTRPRTTQTPPAAVVSPTVNPLTARPPSFNFVIPSGGMNMTMSQQGPEGGSIFSFIPWGSSQGAAPPTVPSGAPAAITAAAPAATTAAAPAATTAAAPAATTAAAAATTAAAAETTAAGATTAAPTTAAAAGK